MRTGQEATIAVGFAVAVAVADTDAGVREQLLRRVAVEKHAHAAEFLVPGFQQLNDRLGRQFPQAMLRMKSSAARP